MHQARGHHLHRLIRAETDAAFAFTAGSFDAPEDTEWPRYFVGTPDKVTAKLHSLAAELNLDELIINTITHSHAARVRSYELLAEAMEL